MKNKRIIAVAMATGMAVSLAACGGSASTTDTTGTADAATTEAAAATDGEASADAPSRTSAAMLPRSGRVCAPVSKEGASVGPLSVPWAI